MRNYVGINSIKALIKTIKENIYNKEQIDQMIQDAIAEMQSDTITDIDTSTLLSPDTDSDFPEPECYSFHLNTNSYDQSRILTYTGNNLNYVKASMNYDTNKFNYGSWENAWFIRRCQPCMLNYDGTIAYVLDKNDYTKKADGTASDIDNPEFNGNVMIAIPKVYWKIVPLSSDSNNQFDIYVSKTKLDDDYVCWSHINSTGEELDYCFISAYEGASDGTRMRSISGMNPGVNKSISEKIDLAKLNNTDANILQWFTSVWCDRTLINILCMLITKSTDSQTAFGNGNSTYGNTDDAENGGILLTGTMNDKGLFWGTNSNYTTGVKLFGIENYFGNTSDATAGLLSDTYGNLKVKMTYGTEDGTTLAGYVTYGGDSCKYIKTNKQVDKYEGYLNSVRGSSNWGLIPLAKSSTSGYSVFCDLSYFKSIGTSSYPLLGGDCKCIDSESDYPGIFAVRFTGYEYTSNISVYENVRLSCKP